MDGSVLQVGTQIFYIGGSDGTTAQSTVYVAATVGTGNFDKWTEGPALPEPRSDASVVYIAGSIYVIGGRDASGAPTTTVFVLSPDSQTGALGEWSTADYLALPEPRSNAAAAITPGRPAAGRWPRCLRTGDDDLQDAARIRPASSVPGRRSSRSTTRRSDATAVLIGDYLWLYGGRDANGPTGAVQRGAFGKAAAEGLPANPDVGKLIRWDVNNSANLPVARTNASGWGANGAIYLAGGDDGTGPQVRGLLGGPDEQRRHPGMEAPRGQRPAGLRTRGRPGRRQRRRGDHRRREDRPEHGPGVERPGQHRTAQPVLPARPGRCDRPGPQDRGRDRPAARLPQRGHGRRHQLHPADPRRRRVRPQGADQALFARILHRARRK